MGMALMGVGGLIFALGVVLYMGNRTGFLVTFPLAGFITMGIGGALIGLGRKLQADAAAKATEGA